MVPTGDRIKKGIDMFWNKKEEKEPVNMMAMCAPPVPIDPRIVELDRVEMKAREYRFNRRKLLEIQAVMRELRPIVEVTAKHIGQYIIESAKVRSSNEYYNDSADSPPWDRLAFLAGQEAELLFDIEEYEQANLTEQP